MTACNRCKQPTNLDRGELINEPYTGIGSELGLCRECRCSRQQDLWEAAPDWNAILKLNLLFLRGEVDCNPNNSGPLDAETTPLIPGLIKLHEYGIFTCESQPFEKSNTFTKGEGWWQGRQRPYLHFILPTLHPDIPIDSIDTFVEKIFADRRIFVSVYSEFDEYAITADSSRRRRVVPQTSTRPTYHFRTNVRTSGVTVSIFRSAKTSKGLMRKAWSENTFFRYTSVAVLPRNQSQCGWTTDGKNFEAAVVSKRLAIGIMARKWGERLDLQDILRQHCEEAGLRRVLDVDSRI